MKKKVIAILAAGAMISALFAGCGSSSQETKEESAASEVSVTSGSEAESTGMANPWSDAESAEEAAKGAGLDGMELPADIDLDLGENFERTYRYMDGLAEITLEYAASQLTVRKGTVGEEGDVSGDYNEYANTWTQDVDGVEVTCSGNKDGIATKAIWTADGMNYSLTCMGLGGDDDFGLAEEPLATLVGSLK